MKDPEHLPTKDLNPVHTEDIRKKILGINDRIDVLHPDWEGTILDAIEDVMGPVHIGSLTPQTLIFVKVEPDEDGLHAKLELTF